MSFQSDVFWRQNEGTIGGITPFIDMSLTLLVRIILIQWSPFRSNDSPASAHE